MTVFGPRALIDIAVPTGIDGAEVFRIDRQDGANVSEIIAEAAATIGMKNEEILQRYGGLLRFTQEPFARYRQGASARTETPRLSEFADPDPVRTEEIGHMLPIYDYRDGVAWSAEYLRRAAREQLFDDLSLIGERWVNRVDRELLTRALTNTENPIGSAGYDVPWAIGTGTNVNYIPPQYRSYTFDATHTHFVWRDATFNAAGLALLLNDMVVQLRHHGHEGRLVALLSDADLTIARAMNEFVAQTPFTVVMTPTSGTTPVQVTGGEVQGVPGELFGYFNSVRGVVELRYHERVPSKYAFMTKSYGLNDQRNGLAVRIASDRAFGLTVNPQVDRSLVPRFESIKFEATHGVGVNNRTNGVAGFVDTGAVAYVNPTIA